MRWRIHKRTEQKEDGRRIYYYTFTPAEPSCPDKGTRLKFKATNSYQLCGNLPPSFRFPPLREENREQRSVSPF
ncbi:MAG: hypothetical protein ABDI19_12645 [Armatimonadota bacterium]